MNKLKKFREEAKITQKAMAEKLGISKSYYNQLENGVRKMSLDNALKIALILNQTLNDIFLPSDFANCQVNDQSAAKEAI